jgi:predicted nucleotidyltransferase
MSTTTERAPSEAEVLAELRGAHDASAIVLYGSRAAPDTSGTNEESDWDVLVLSTSAQRRTAEGRWWRGVYLDVFIEPVGDGAQASLQVEERHLCLVGGRAMFDPEGHGARLLEAVQALARRGPPPLTPQARRRLVDWHWRTLTRAKGGSPASDYRRVELLHAALSDYFTLRGQWYPGLKPAITHLEDNDPAGSYLLAQALMPGAGFDALEAWIAHVTKEPPQRPLRS